MNLLFVGFIWCVSHFVCYFSVKRKSVKMHLDDLLCCKFNSPWCFYLSVFLLLAFYSSLILFCGLKYRLNQYLQHKKLNLTYCVKSISGPEAYIQGPDRRGKHGASWSHQSVRKCVFAEYTRERAVARLYVWNAFFLLIGISSIHSDRVILAMKDYLVGGHSRKEVCEKYQMNNGYFSTTLGRLIRLNALAARLAPYYTDESSAFD